MDPIVRCGTVVAIEGASCRVEMERGRCAGCAGRCSAGLSLLGEVALEVASEPAQTRPAVGDSVSVGVPRRGMAAAAIAVFGLPLAAMALGGAGRRGAGWQRRGRSGGRLSGGRGGRLGVGPDRAARRVGAPRLVTAAEGAAPERGRC